MKFDEVKAPTWRGEPCQIVLTNRDEAVDFDIILEHDGEFRRVFTGTGADKAHVARLVEEMFAHQAVVRAYVSELHMELARDGRIK